MNILKFSIILLSVLLSVSCKKNNDNFENFDSKVKRKSLLSDIKKIENLGDNIFVLSEMELFYFKEDSSKAEKVNFQDSLYPLDFIVKNNNLYILGISHYKLKLVKGNLDKWEQIELPDYINTVFVDSSIARYNRNAKVKPRYDVNYDVYDSNQPDNFHKLYKLYEIFSINIHIIADKQPIILIRDSIYFREKDNWISYNIPTFDYFTKEPKIGEIRLVKDSIIYYGFNFGEWGGDFGYLDFNSKNGKWNYLLTGVNISSFIPDKLPSNFWFSTNLAHMGGISGSFSYYNNGKIKKLYDFAGKVYKKEFAKEDGTVISDIKQIGEKIFILTEDGIFLYEKNKIVKLIDDYEEFEKFYVDEKENIYVNSKNAGFIKYTKADNHYSMNKISFYKFD